MAKNKAKAAEAQWLAKRQRMGPPGPDEPRFRPKRERRYSYASQLSTITAGSIESTLDQLVAARGELIVTLNLCGVDFYVAVGLNPKRFGPRNEPHIESLDVPPTIRDLTDATLHMHGWAKVPFSFHQGGVRKTVYMERGVNGVIYPVSYWPDVYGVEQLVQVQLSRYDPRNMWGVERRMGGKLLSYEQAAKQLPAFLYSGEHWDE